MAALVTEEEARRSPFLSRHHLFEREKARMNENIEAFYQRLRSGLNAMRAQATCMGQEEHAYFLAACQEIDQWTEATILSEQSASLLYSMARQLIAGAKQKEAADLLFLCAFLAPDYFETWLALGTLEHQYGRTEDALHMYAQAALLAPEQALAHLFNAEGLCELERQEEAKQSLELAKASLQDFPEEALKLAPRIKTLEQSLLKRP